MTDRYQIINLIEKDQLGSMYLAQDTTLQRKVIYRDFEHTDASAKPEEFSSYTGKLCALQHPNLLTIYDISINDDGYFMVTQFLEAESLVQRLTQGAINQVGVHNLACDLLDALHAAHSSGLYHGALRTDSIKRIPRVRGGHRYMVVDFGMDRISTMICGRHVIMADPVLMAPELVGGKKPADGQSDLFTLGQLCYISLVGGHPYAGKSPEACAQAYRDGGLPHLNTYVQGVQQDFADWVMWLVSGKPDDRPFSSHEAMAALHAIRLKAPAPNVPGVTQAVDVPNMPEPNQPKITEPVMVSSELEPKPAKKSAATKVSKEGGLLLLAVGSVICLLVVLILVLVFRDDSSSAQGSSASSNKSMVVLQKTQTMTQTITNNKIKSINLDTGKAIDWTVITGVPAASARVLKKGGRHITNILALGEFTELIHQKKTVSYTAGGSTITSQTSVTNSKKGGAVEGEGWEVFVRIPEKQEGALLLTLFMVQNQCDFTLEVRSTHKSNEGEVDKMNIAQTQPGIVKIPLKISQPLPGYYTFRVLATSVNKATGFEMGLSAVLLESI
jgi:serine/threonine protein kinase